MSPGLRFLHVLADGWSSAGLILLAGGVLGRGFCLRRTLSVREARMVRRSDRLLWIGALVHFTGGIGLHFLVTSTGGWEGHPWIRLPVLVALLGLDVWPARRFRSWARHLDLNQVPYHTDRDHDRMYRLWQLQVALLFVLPLLQPVGARSYGP